MFVHDGQPLKQLPSQDPRSGFVERLFSETLVQVTQWDILHREVYALGILKPSKELDKAFVILTFG